MSVTPPPQGIAAVLDRIAALPAPSLRHLVAIAGPPGSGKSTLAAALAQALGPSAAAVPMDGFHLDNALLDSRGLRHRKGAPETFDADGFVLAMRRLASEPDVILPVFDRDRDIAIAGRIEVAARHRVVLVEGNYLFLDQPPWRDLGGLWSLCVFLNPGLPELRRRLVRRWRDHGLAQAEAEARAEDNDLANAARVLASLHRPSAPWIEL